MAVVVRVQDIASDDERRALESIFTAYGIDVTIDGTLRTRGGVGPYVVVVTAPVVYIALSFVRGAAEEAGAETWEAYRNGGWRGLRRFLQEVAWAHDAERLSRSRRAGAWVEIHIDEPEGLRVRLQPGLTDEELRSLGELDWPSMRKGGTLLMGQGGKWELDFEPAPRRDVR